MSDSEIFFEVHTGLPREAPGDEGSTVRALEMMTDLPAAPELLDIACGPGGQTIVLACHSAATITAVDIHEPFLEELQRRAAAAGVKDRITTIKASMFDLALGRTFGAIWSEGAIYMIGFVAALRAWRALLRPGGYIAVTELSWIKTDPPRDIAEYWHEQYPGVSSLEENRAHVRAAGYRGIGQFAVPESAWWDSYYQPMERSVAEFRRKYEGNADVQRVLDIELTEIDMYRRYSDWYGYVFYVMRAK